jgi:hypothetical protein
MPAVHLKADPYWCFVIVSEPAQIETIPTPATLAGIVALQNKM